MGRVRLQTDAPATGPPAFARVSGSTKARADARISTREPEMLTAMRLRKPTEVSPGVYMLGSRWVNFYLVVEASDTILIDAGYTRYDSQLVELLSALGTSPDAIVAVFVTHHHVDHVGTAEFARRHRARVFGGAGDADKIRGTEKSHPPVGFFRHAWRPMMVRYLVHTTLAGGASYRSVTEIDHVLDGKTMDLPGHPRIVSTPGHTLGHFSIHMAERGLLFTGDALMNFDYTTGERGPKLHRFNEDRDSARSALGTLATLEAETLLFGHGDPWPSGVKSAVGRAMYRDESGH